MRKLQTLFALALAAPGALAAQVQTQTEILSGDIPYVTLDEALRLSRQHAPSMRTQRNSVRNASLALTQRYANFLPSISTNASYRPAQNGAAANYSAGLNIGLSSIFDYNSYFSVASARRQKDVAEANFVAAQYQLSAQVKQQYFAALQAQEALTVQRNNLRVLERQLELAAARVRAGTGIAPDSLTAQNNLFNGQIQLFQAENSLQAAFRNLSRTIGLETIIQPDPRDTAEFRVVELDSAALIAMLDDSPSMKQQQAQVANAKQSLRTARLQFIPRPSGSIGFNRSGSGEGIFGFDDGRYRYSGGRPSINFSISLPIFAGLSREINLTQQLQNVDNAQRNIAEQRLNQVNQLLNLLGQIRVTELQMELQQKQLVVQELTHMFLQTRYDLDLVTQLELMTAQNQLFNTRNQMVNTRYNYRNQIAQLETLVGRDIR